MAETEYLAGRGAPLPDYVNDITLARWLGVAPWELMDAPQRWVDAASMVMSAENTIQREQERQQQQGTKRPSGRRR